MANNHVVFGISAKCAGARIIYKTNIIRFAASAAAITKKKKKQKKTEMKRNVPYTADVDI